MVIPEEIIEKVKEQNDIIDVISETVKLKRSGRNYFGLCPFHHEKTPSFSVSSDKQIYKCFGCGEAGNVITFVMKHRNLSYVEAIKFLADRANIAIEEDKDKKGYDKRNILYKINVEAAKYFFNNLNKSKMAKEYFIKRGISETTIRRFGLGYSLNSWDSLLKFLKAKGFSPKQVSEAGLSIAKNKGGFYDRFRNRVMFPVFDHRGRVIGFGGRVLDDSKPKYLNSPETMIFYKGTNLYGLNFAIKSNNNDRTFIIVEGYMDCISLHQHGITNVVASLGTALTVNQARLLKRYADKVIISYDADLAGQMATLRGLEILKNTGFDLRVLSIPEAKDPDEYIRVHGKEAFLELVHNAKPFIDYRLDKAKEGINFSNNEMVIKYIRNVMDILANLDTIEKNVYIKKISEETGIGEQVMYDVLKGQMAKKSDYVQNSNSITSVTSNLYVEPAYIKAERSLLKLMLEKDNYNLITSNLEVSELILNSHKKIYNIIIESCLSERKDIENYIESKCDDAESLKEWIYIKEMDLMGEESDREKLIKDYKAILRKYRLEESKKEIMEKIKTYENKGMIEESLSLAKKLIELQKEIDKEGIGTYGGRK